MKILPFGILLLGFHFFSHAQIVDSIYHKNIKTVTISSRAEDYIFPMLTLGRNQSFTLRFDDMDNDYKSYYYTFVLCDRNWQPSQLNPFDYIEGFVSQQINEYRSSVVEGAPYTHYYVDFPSTNSYPTKSGNYILKVFLDDDISEVVFTKRFLVVEHKVSVSGKITLPFNNTFKNDFQKIVPVVSSDHSKSINYLSPQETTVVILQNNNWNTVTVMGNPTIFRSDYLEYNDERYTLFEAGNEWRWLDMRSLRLMSDRVEKLDYSGGTVNLNLKTDYHRKMTRTGYVYYKDLNGGFIIENLDGSNPFWQSEYADVHFSYRLSSLDNFNEQKIYFYSAVTDYKLDQNTEMEYNSRTGNYELTLSLKQGYYDYSYVSIQQNKLTENLEIGFKNTEGNYSSTENNYIILVYYHPFGGRNDRLVGYALINTYLM